jgi:phosphoribosylformylglycinamidine cyclo-ligase
VSRAERYRAAGVDLDALGRAKARIAEAVAGTRTALARGLPGAFGGMVRLPADVRDPTLVMSTDGVGTKVLVALEAGRHDTVGEDLVNHCVNDILVHGARPLAFLDYIAGADVPADTLVGLVDGVARGCRAHGMTLAGGETAQMPGLYAPGHYDLAGTIVGVVAEGAALHGDRVRVGDTLVGYAASGLHTNGYSLARRILFTEQRLGLADDVPELGGAVGEVLLRVHRSYWAAVSPVVDRVHALAHITGGGIPENLARVLPPGRRARVRTAMWPRPGLFAYLQRAGGVSDDEMFGVFNMGVGMIAVAATGDVDGVRAAAGRAGVETWPIGEICAGDGVELV